MRTALLLLALCCICAALCHSQSLLQSRQGSNWTYVYQISNRQAETVCRSKKWEIDPAFFHTLRDSFPAGSAMDRQFAPGHYLLTRTEKNQLKLDLLTVQFFDVAVLNNSADLCIAVYDTLGRILPGALVKAGQRRIPFDAKTQSFRLPKTNKEGMLSVEYGGLIAYFDLRRRWNNPAITRTLNRAPLGYIYRPVQFVLRAPPDAVASLISGRTRRTTRSIGRFFGKAGRSIACIFDDWACDRDREERFEDRWRGYMAFNKPKYLPGDTVKLKAFVVRKNGRPLEDSISVVLEKNWKKNVHLTYIAPHRPGTFDLEFALHDSLDLQLDRHYRVILQNRKKRNYLEDWLRYEDYELKSAGLALRCEEKTQFRGKPFSIFLKGTDENELNLLDARVELTLLPAEALNFHAPQVFLPDTLWYWEQALEPYGETEIAIPDSIFPVVDLSYRIRAVLLTSDNEHVLKEEALNFYHTRREFHFSLERDSIRFEYREDGQSRPAQAILSGFDPLGHAVSERLVQLPYTEKINPWFATYQLDDGILKEKFSPGKESAGLQCYGDRSYDSLRIRSANPRRIPFRYFLYRGNREIARGYDTDLDLVRPSGEKEGYSISLQYLWAGRMQSEHFAVGFQRRRLEVNVEQPDLIYPGQEVEIVVTVTDVRGRPVPDADLTAYAVTQKFKPSAPELPSFDKAARGRRFINSFTTQRRQPAVDALLDFPYWRDKARLDTNEYYRFLYPGKEVYRYAYPTADSTAQFAPFVLKDGAVQPIHVVYVDHKPVYFEWSSTYRPYAFRIAPGYHRIELRTGNMLFRLDSLYFPPHQKLIFSLGDSVQSPKVRITPMPSSLTQAEKDNLYRYIFPYRNNFTQPFPYLRQNGEIIPLWQGAPFEEVSDYSSRVEGTRRLAGPVMPGKAVLEASGAYRTPFEHEAMMSYEFAPGLLKMRSVESRYASYPGYLYGIAREKLDDEAVTEAQALQWQQLALDNLRRQKAFYDNPSRTPPGKARLRVLIGGNSVIPHMQALNTLLFMPGNPQFIRIYPGQPALCHDLDAGRYRLILLYPEAAYALFDSIDVRAGGLNYFSPDSVAILPPDSFSLRCRRIIEEKILAPEAGPGDMERKLRALQGAIPPPLSYTGPGRRIEGRLVDENGEPLIGATVQVPGMSIGTVTDFDGYYSIIVPEGATLQVSYTGFSTVEVDPASSGVQNITLQEDVMQLSEVVVVGYSVERVMQDAVTKALDSGNITIEQFNHLAGRIYGLTTIEDSEDYREIKIGEPVEIAGNWAYNFSDGGLSIRSSRSDGVLYFIDGVRVQGDLENLDPQQLQRIEIIQGQSALALFGPDAAAGAVLITTKAGAKGAVFDAAFLEGATEASSIRSNFSDYAFWLPRLRTDKQGKAAFRVVFPDDITQWRTFVPAMTARKQSGVGEARSRSFKPVSARLSVPRFLVQGDTAWAIGKALNYTSDTIEVSSAFSVNEEAAAPRPFQLSDAVTDSVLLAPQSLDSVAVQFSVTRPDGYFDGERRHVPVYPQGVERTAGLFWALEGDTSIVAALPGSIGEGTLHARADVLDIVREDIARLVQYEYDCNEQMASKLLALLADEEVAAFKEQGAGRNKAQINRLISRLEKNRNEQGLWGWWNRSASEFWISAHVLNALGKARRKGYKVEALPRRFAEEAVWELESNRANARKIEVLRLMSAFDVQLDFSAYLPFLAQDTALAPADRFMLIELQQKYGLSWPLDTLEKYRRETLLGNVYFSAGDETPAWHPAGGELQLTLSAYRILQRDSTTTPELLSRIRNYLLEQRGAGLWLNTYASAQIVEAFSSGLQKDTAEMRRPELHIGERRVQDFPFEMRMAPGDTLRVRKTGDYPVYLTAYRRYREMSAEADSALFGVRARFAGGSEVLQAGKPEKLIVEVEVHKAAQYVLIEAPIPAACSYESKRAWYPGENHREYFRHKTVIFCTDLKPGTHTFEIDLVPRYSGTFTLNPAKVELMYFPVFGANAEGKQVMVR